MSNSSDFDPDSIIRTASRLPTRPKLSSVEVKRRAETYLVAPPSAELLKAYRLTATGGVVALMHYQELLRIAPRTIRKYGELGLLERLPDRTPKLRKIGLKEPTADLRLYTLGPVGHAMAELEAITAPSGYHALVDRVTHDFLATHVVVKFLLAAQARGFDWEWRNRYQATVQFEYGKESIEPDAALRLSKVGEKQPRVFLLEFHNEDHSKRVAGKLFRYYRVHEGRTLKSVHPWWGVPHPTLLAVSPYPAPVNAYFYAFTDPENHAHYDRDYMSKQRADHLPPNPVFGGSLATLSMQRLWEVWANLRNGSFMNIFTGAAANRPA
jgi:hypothetical protein